MTAPTEDWEYKITAFAGEQLRESTESMIILIEEGWETVRINAGSDNCIRYGWRRNRANMEQILNDTKIIRAHRMGSK